MRAVADVADRRVPISAQREVVVPERLWKPVCDRFGPWAARQWFAAPNDHLRGQSPATAVVFSPERVERAVDFLLAA